MCGTYASYGQNVLSFALKRVRDILSEVTYRNGGWGYTHTELATKPK